MCVHSFIFFFKQKTAYEMRISDWSSDVCSSDLFFPVAIEGERDPPARSHLGREPDRPQQDRGDSRPRTRLGFLHDEKREAHIEPVNADRKSTRLNSSH